MFAHDRPPRQVQLASSPSMVLGLGAKIGSRHGTSPLSGPFDPPSRDTTMSMHRLPSRTATGRRSPGNDVSPLRTAKSMHGGRFAALRAASPPAAAVKQVTPRSSRSPLGLYQERLLRDAGKKVFGVLSDKALRPLAEAHVRQRLHSNARREVADRALAANEGAHGGSESQRSVYVKGRDGAWRRRARDRGGRLPRLVRAGSRAAPSPALGASLGGTVGSARGTAPFTFTQTLPTLDAVRAPRPASPYDSPRSAHGSSCADTPQQGAAGAPGWEEAWERRRRARALQRQKARDDVRRRCTRTEAEAAARDLERFEARQGQYIEKPAAAIRAVDAATSGCLKAAARLTRSRSFILARMRGTPYAELWRSLSPEEVRQLYVRAVGETNYRMSPVQWEQMHMDFESERPKAWGEACRADPLILRTMFDAIDCDGDARASFTEFICAIALLRQKPQANKTLTTLFSVLAGARNGRLQPRDLQPEQQLALVLPRTPDAQHARWKASCSSLSKLSTAHLMPGEFWDYNDFVAHVYLYYSRYGHDAEETFGELDITRVPAGAPGTPRGARK